MSDKPPASPHRSNRLGHTGGDAPAAAPGPAGPTSAHDDPRARARAQLMNDITGFLLTHDLEISPFTLGLAHDFFTGNDGQMMRRIAARVQSGEPVTLEWLEQAAREIHGDPLAVLARQMTTLETNIEEFDRTSNTARAAAADYGSALEAHVDHIANQPPDAAILARDLLGLTRDMLATTRAIEQDMARSVLETKALRRSLEQARRAAEKDHLTGLPNRRAFENRLASEYAAAKAAKEHLCLAFCDIDNFKRINDEHGHEAGDRVLKSVAGNLARISNDGCYVARHGGEEFVILLRGPSLHEAWDILDHARQQLAERRLVNRQNDTPFGKITFSAGLADVFAYGDARAALRAADSALYRAKSEGRNRIVIAPAHAAPLRAPPLSKAS